MLKIPKIPVIISFTRVNKLFTSYNLVTTRQISNKFGFALAAPRFHYSLFTFNSEKSCNNIFHQSK